VIILNWPETIYQYDGTFEGFLCCIFESYVHKEFPTAFFGDGECIFSLYAVRQVLTDPANARRVYVSLVKRSPTAVTLLRKGFLTCMEEKERYLYALVQKVYSAGTGFLCNRADDTLYPVLKAIRRLDGELEKYRGFVRFSDYGRVLGGEIEPKNRVLPLLRGHFCARYANEAFFLYDRTHHELLLYAGGKSKLAEVDSVELSAPCEDEYLYRNLWKKFYDTVEIQPRHNPRCQNTQLPKRYRHMMTEFQPESYFRPTASPAVSPVPAVPAGRPAPAIPEGSEPSAPESIP
jgi:probable DNA metabolism protein